ncbi:MAG: rhomboid family intramembrane serine protease [Candidatus Aenigmatarchaeota archaeon]
MSNMKYNWYAFKLIAICAAIFILQNIYPSLTESFSLDVQQILSSPWIIITYMFLHGSFEHLFFNMFALGMFGSILEQTVGGKKFLLIFFASGIAAGIGSLLFYTSSIGASGAIYGVLGTLAVLRPRMTVYVSFVPLPMILAVVFWAAGDLLGLFSTSDLIAHAAHLFGLVFGLLYGMLLRKDYGEYHVERKKDEISDEEMNRWEDRYMGH